VFVEHHTHSVPIRDSWEDFEKLRKIWERRGYNYLLFTVIRDPKEIQESAFSYCSPSSKKGPTLPKLWQNILSCTSPNFMSGYIELDRFCSSPGVTQELNSSDSDKIIKWLHPLQVYELGRIDILIEDLQRKFILRSAVQYSITNTERSRRMSFFGKFKEVKFSLHTECKFSKRYVKTLARHLSRIEKNDSLIFVDQTKIQEHFFCDERIHIALQSRAH